MNILLSYPRSGNHLVRFFIEILTETPTVGCKGNERDIPIYQNSFPSDIDFNINDNYNQTNAFHKYHNCKNLSYENIDNLILIIRNPREALLRCNNQIDISYYNQYFSIIDFYLGYQGNKILFFYENIITNHEQFIISLYNFLPFAKKEKLDYVLNNLDFLYQMSAKGSNRAWSGINSTSINFYYPKIDPKFKLEFDKQLSEKLGCSKYQFIRNKYTIE